MDYTMLRQRMVQLLEIDGTIRTESVRKAMLETPRHLYVPERLRHLSYEDAPLPIGGGQTISAPHMVAIMCEALQLREGEKVLEIGAGSGYHAAVMSRIVGDGGMVYSVERFPELAEQARANIESDGRKNVRVAVGDGTEGLPEFAPYDAVIVACAAPEIPKPLVEQTKEGRRILIPIGRMPSDLTLAHKTKGGLDCDYVCGCMFVPLVGKYGFNG